MRFGILCAAYSCADSLDEVMAPWFSLSKKYDFVISVVSARFKEYEDLGIEQNNGMTIKKLGEYVQDKKIQYLEVPDKSLMEHEARNLALNHISQSDCDIVWILDGSDEYYIEEQIEKIIEYINNEDNQFYAWFSIPFKNYIFSGKEWVDGFCPPRIFKHKFTVARLSSFDWDNDTVYTLNGVPYSPVHSYRELPHKSIPKILIGGGIRHLTWLDNEKSHQKVIYQEKHFNGTCSYKWEDGHLRFNDNYYKKSGQSLPIIYKDE